jgi:hypothetical protein
MALESQGSLVQASQQGTGRSSGMEVVLGEI